MPTEPIRPTVQRFSWGGATVTTILDGAHLRTPLKPPFLLDTDDGDLPAVARPHRLPHDRFENTYTLTVIETGGQVVLFDVGFGAAGCPGGPQEGAGQLRERLGQAGYAPEDIDVVAFTAHPDHILGTWEGDSLSYPNARHAVGRREFDAWKDGSEIPEQREKNREMFLKIIAPLEDRLTFLAGGDEIAPGLFAEEAFGHSLGHMMYRLKGGPSDLLVWGDVSNHYAFSIPRPEQRVGFDDDKPQAVETRKRVLNMVADQQTLVIGYHMPFPATGYVERDGDSFRWVPATYQLWV